MENVVLLCEGLVGLTVFVFCLVFKVIIGKSPKQKFAEKAKAQGRVTTAYYKNSKVRRGDWNERENSLGDDVYTVWYTYIVNGTEYQKKLIFSTSLISPNYPAQITIYYDLKNPQKCVTGGEITQNAQQGRGCLITVVATLAAMGLTANILNRILGIHY